MSRILTPEDLDALRQMNAINNPDLAQPYNRQADTYQQQASDLEQQAATPYPQPQGAKERTISALRAAMESFGRYGAPGGYEGAEARRQGAFANENEGRLTRAKELRNQALQQQELGQRTVQQAGSQRINEGNLDETRKLRGIQEQAEGRLQAEAQQPKVIPGQPGQPYIKQTPGQPDEMGTFPGEKPAPALTGIAGEYEYAKKGGYTGSFEDYQNADANRKKVQPAATIQVLQAGNSAAGMDVPVSDALQKATANMIPSRRAQFAQLVNAQYSRGDVNGTKATIKQAAIEGEPVGVRSQIQGRRELHQALSEIEQLLSGIPQGLITGTIEDTARRLGQTTDPNMVKVGSRLLALNQSYRKAITGAQFSQQEGAEYAKLLPGYSNSEPVNMNLIRGLQESIKTNDNVYWSYKLGPGWSDFEMGQPAAQQPASGGMNIKPGGAVERLLRGQ